MEFSRAQEHLFAADREVLLKQVRLQRKKRFWVPAQVVRECILESGWRILRADDVEPNVLGVCDVWQQAVLIPRDIRKRLKHPHTTTEVTHEVLAHELGHLRLHVEPMLAGMVKEPDWEEEATFYARVFLIPRAQLMKRLETQRLLEAQEFCQSVRWSYVLRLAEEFRVTGAFLAETLVAYGLIYLDSQSRHITIAPQARQHLMRYAFYRTA